MKKNPFYMACGAFIIITILAICPTRAGAAPDPAASLTATPHSPEDRIGISAKAIREFKKQFKEVNNEKWEAIPGGFLSSFSRDGVMNRVYYNEAGSWQFTVRQAEEDLLPSTLKAAVRSVYYDYTITCVHEILSSGNLVYIATVEDKKTVKKIKISGDREFEVIEDWVKE